MLTELLLQGRLLDEGGQPRKTEAVEDPHNFGFSLEYVSNSCVPTANFVRLRARKCLGEQSLTLPLKLSCDLLLSTSQGWTLQRCFT